MEYTILFHTAAPGLQSFVHAKHIWNIKFTTLCNSGATLAQIENHVWDDLPEEYHQNPDQFKWTLDKYQEVSTILDSGDHIPSGCWLAIRAM